MKDKRITIKVSSSDQKAIFERAKELGLTVSEYLRRLVIIDIAKKDQ